MTKNYLDQADLQLAKKLDYSEKQIQSMNKTDFKSLTNLIKTIRNINKNIKTISHCIEYRAFKD